MLHLSQRPLTAARADQALFVDRERERRLILRAVGLNLHTFVAGAPGTGKTSLLHRVEAELGDRALYVNAERVESWGELSDAIGGRARRRAGPPGSADPFAAALTRGGELPGGHRPVILLDDLSADVRHEVFGRGRDLVWEASTIFVVTSRLNWLPEPEDTFFTATVELDAFPAAVLADMLQRRATSGHGDEVATFSQAVAAALDTATPRRALAVATSLLLSDDVESALQSLRRHGAKAADLSPSARDVLEAVEALGPVHAGDDRLLAEVGVTRTRVVQILQELERSRLVRSSREGRRVLYRSTAVEP